MEKITKVINLKNKDKEIFNMGLVGFYLDKEEVNDKKVTLTFIRDLSKEDLTYCLNRNKTYQKSNVMTIIPLFILLGVAVVLLTIFMVFLLINKEVEPKPPYIYIFLIVGIIFFIAASIYSFIRTNKINYYLNQGQKEVEQITLEVRKEIKEHEKGIN